MVDAILERANKLATLTIAVVGLIATVAAAWATLQWSVSHIGKTQDGMAAQLARIDQAVTRLEQTVVWNRADLTRLEARLYEVERRGP